MKKLIITIAILLGLSTVSHAGSLESELKSIIKQAETCLENKDCETFIEANPLIHNVMSNPVYVEKLTYNCQPGSNCFSLSMVASDLVMKASLQVIEGAFK